MTRLIDADALKKEFGYTDEWYKSRTVTQTIDNAPTIPLPDFKEGYKQAILDGKTNYSRPQGKWDVISLLRDYVYIRCSECGQCTRLVRDSKNEFCCIKDIRDKIVACPYCGADMREAEK